MESSLTAKAPNNMMIDPAEAHPATPGFHKKLFSVFSMGLIVRNMSIIL